MWTWFYKLASPPYVYGVAAAFVPWFLGLAAITIGYGLIAGLGFAPPDYQQGDAFRIIYVHVPSAYMSLFCYSAMALAGAIGLIWRIKMSYALAAATAPVGASFTAGATGSAFWIVTTAVTGVNSGAALASTGATATSAWIAGAAATSRISGISEISDISGDSRVGSTRPARAGLAPSDLLWKKTSL